MIALAFVPSTLTAIRDVREADRARTGGKPVRRGRLVRQVVPVVELGLEHAVTLAESMDSRGFARGTATRRDRSVGLLGVVALLGLGGAFVALVGRSNTLALVLGLGGTSAVVAAVALASSGSARVRYRPHRLTRTDRWTMAGVTGAPVALALCSVIGDSSLVWVASPLVWPALHLFPVLCLAPLLAPVTTRAATTPVVSPHPIRGAETAFGECGTVSAISYSRVTFAYPDSRVAALREVDLEVEPGSVLLIIGSSGSGKSTLLRAANGLVPHASGGQFAGEVVAFGRSTRSHQPRELADVVGFVAQDPESQSVVDEVERDIAFVLENLGFSQAAMRRRVEEVLDALGIAHLRDRDPSTLSGGERQRCAIAAALAASPSALVLDEPTSQLDPQGADDVLAAITRLNADLGTTILIAEHRLERAAPLASHAILVAEGRVERYDTPAAVVADYPGAPAVTQLGRLLGWEALPLTVRDARALALADALAADLAAPGVDDPPAPGSALGEVLVQARGLEVVLGRRAVLHGVDVEVRQGEVVALLGRNGSGKTTLLRALAGLVPVARGTVESTGRVAYVPQNPNALLFASSVRAELTETQRLLGRANHDRVAHWLEALGLESVAERHPRSLSGGERRARRRRGRRGGWRAHPAARRTHQRHGRTLPFDARARHCEA